MREIPKPPFMLIISLITEPSAYSKVQECVPSGKTKILLDKYHRDFVPALNQSTK
jgi:hypothetical protein